LSFGSSSRLSAIVYVSAGVFRGIRFAMFCASTGVIPMQRATSVMTLLA
jgi:hypothetical protein